MWNSRLVLLVLILSAGLLTAGCSFDLSDLVPVPAAPEAPVPEIVTLLPPATAYETLTALEWTEVPQRDLASLAQRLRQAGNVPTVAREAPLDYLLGDMDRFWIIDADTNAHSQITAVLQVATPHLYAWVQEEGAVDLDALRLSAERFESQTYPTTRATFGNEWSPGIDGDPHLYVLHAHGLGSTVGGYFSSSDEFSRLAYPYSNEHEMFYVNLDTVSVGSAFYDGVLAHEFLHMIHWHADRNEELWLNEGLAELSAYLNGFDPGSPDQAYLARPDIQLNDFDYQDAVSSAHYGGAYLFTRYLWERFGLETIRALVAHPANGVAGVAAALQQVGYDIDIEALFADWAVALYLDDPSVADGRYGFPIFDPGRPALAAEHVSYPVGYRQETVRQFASDYIWLTGDRPITVVFTATQQVRLAATDPHGGQAYWWSNRGDEIDTSLSRAFDLSGLSTATLDFWLWYDIETDWDYAYLQVSRDGGWTWDTIPTAHTTDENPTGNNYGHGYTGRSGGGDTPQWVHEQIDLSAYAGQPVLIRFEYITDGAIHETGLLLDDLALPELGFQDGFESDQPGWEAAGFVRSHSWLPQRWIVQLVELGLKPRVQQLALNKQGLARWQVPLSDEVQQAVLIVSAVTPATLEPVSYAYRIEQD